MHISALQLVIAITIIGAIAILVWLFRIVFRREHHTRERFAFVALAGLLTMGSSVVSCLAHKETPWGATANIVREALGLPPTNDPPRFADHALMVLAFSIICAVVVRFYEGWNGAVSVRQFTKQRYHEPTPFLVEGLCEAKRVLMREPRLQIHLADQVQYLPSVLGPPEESLAWHMQARDLISLRYPNYSIDRNKDWHEEEHCWIGFHKKSSEIVAVRCEALEISHNQTVRFIEYVTRVARRQNRSMEGAELIVATRSLASTEETEALGFRVRKETESSLLEGLVDFSDYFSEIRHRVEKDSLPDSSLTIGEVYTPSSCRDENGDVHPNLEAYLRSWLSDGTQRQIALLGEYGQGKSTAALMLAYNLINSAEVKQRVPIVVELRGKSPRNLTPGELLAGWAIPYSISPLAVMKLLVAGRVLLILEGFDEMALVGDSEARLGHFRTLWKFAYPKAKILITGRPNFFLDDREMRLALGIFRSDAAGPYCEAIHLVPFSVEQISSALRSAPEQTRLEIVSLAVKDAKFREIVSRGSLLYVVSQLWVREELSKHASHITSAFVMDLFIRHSYRRQSQKAESSSEFMVLNEGERKYFMSGIAAYMAALELPNQITRDLFERAVKDLYEVFPESVSSEISGLPVNSGKPLRERLKDASDPIQDVANDVRSSGILVMDQSKQGALRFAHKSFMEYLAARVYGEYVTKKNREASSAIITTSHLDARNLLGHPEMLSFLAEIFLDSLRWQGETLPKPISKPLFDLIVVQGSSWKPLGKLAAAFALGDLKSRALVQDLRRRPGGSKLARLLRPSFAILMRPIFLMMLPTLLMTEAVTFGIRAELGTQQAFSAMLLIVVALLLFPLPLLMQSSLRLGSGVRLWFICCVAIGLGEEDIGATTGRRWVSPIKSYLDVDV